MWMTSAVSDYWRDNGVCLGRDDSWCMGMKSIKGPEMDLRNSSAGWGGGEGPL